MKQKIILIFIIEDLKTLSATVGFFAVFGVTLLRCCIAYAHRVMMWGLFQFRADGFMQMNADEGK